MEYSEIRQMPTSLLKADLQTYLKDGCSGIHESVMRSYQILEKVKWLLERGTHPEVLRELIAHMEQEEPKP